MCRGGQQDLVEKSRSQLKLFTADKNQLAKNVQKKLTFRHHDNLGK